VKDRETQSKSGLLLPFREPPTSRLPSPAGHFPGKHHVWPNPSPLHPITVPPSPFINAWVEHILVTTYDAIDDMQPCKM